MLFDNDRLSHWLGGALLAWATIFFLWGLLVFHLGLHVPVKTVTLFSGICCAVQLAVTPWLFYARATPQNPTGQIVQRTAAVIVLLSAITLLFFYFVRRSWPEDVETGRFTAIAIGMTVLFAVFGFIRYCVVPRRRKDEVNS